MVPTRVFKNGNSQAIRIPQELRTDTQDYYITKVGKVFIAYPADDPWTATRMAIGAFAEDYMKKREQPSWDEVEKREEL